MTDRVAEAFAYAREIHAGQTRRGAPMIAHLLAVTSVALRYGADDEEAIAAFLHDAAEDAGGRERVADIRARFGDRVAEIVDSCTDTYEEPPPPWRERKGAYIGHVAEASPSAVLVSAADKLCNVEEILRLHAAQGDAVWEHYDGGREGRIWYYTALRDAFLEHGETPLLREYARRVDALERL